MPDTIPPRKIMLRISSPESVWPTDLDFLSVVPILRTSKHLADIVTKAFQDESVIEVFVKYEDGQKVSFFVHEENAVEGATLGNTSLEPVPSQHGSGGDDQVSS